MKKQLTKEQKDLKLKNLRKLKDICLYISLGLNLLIVLLLIIGSCGNKNSVSSQVYDHNTTSQLIHERKQKPNYIDETNQEALDNYVFDHDVIVGFTLREGDYQISNISGYIGDIVGLEYYQNGNSGISFDDDYRDYARFEVNFNSSNGFIFLSFRSSGLSNIDFTYPYKDNHHLYIPTNYIKVCYINLIYDYQINNQFFDIIQNCRWLVGIYEQEVYFDDTWNIYNYVPNNEGLTHEPYLIGSNSDCYIFTGGFYCPGLNQRYDFIAFEFSTFDVHISDLWNGSLYINADGSLSISPWDDNSHGWERMYVFRGLYFGRTGDANSLVKVAETDFGTGSVRYGVFGGRTETIPSVPIANTFRWLANEFRTIRIEANTFTHYPEFPLNPSRGLNAYDNNVLTYNSYESLLLGYNDPNVIYNFDFSTDTPVNNVFTLLSSAFLGFKPFFDIQLLPGITIGVLVFVPLVATIVLFIVHLLRQ